MSDAPTEKAELVEIKALHPVQSAPLLSEGLRDKWKALSAEPHTTDVFWQGRVSDTDEPIAESRC